MEIEKKYLVKSLPDKLESFPRRRIEQGYLCTDPVVRIRKDDNKYELTYKSSGLMVREEYNLPLTEEAYEHLSAKTDGILIRKDRYLIPCPGYKDLTIELDIFKDTLSPLILAEVEFPDEQTALSFVPPKWFGEDVTFSGQYHNSALSRSAPS